MLGNVYHGLFIWKREKKKEGKRHSTQLFLLSVYNSKSIDIEIKMMAFSSM